MTRLSKLNTVMTITQIVEDVVLFSNENPDRGDATRFYRLSKSDWLELGAPAEITVTAQPGDLLNVVPDDASSLEGDAAPEAEPAVAVVDHDTRDYYCANRLQDQSEPLSTMVSCPACRPSVSEGP